MQTISFLLSRLRESGLGLQDILSEKPWKLKKGKNDFFGVFFKFQMILNNGCLKSKLKK